MANIIYQCTKCNYSGKTFSALTTHNCLHIREEEKARLVHIPDKKFIDCWHTKTYYDIINHARKNPPTDYGENHHIIPRCLGGNNNWKNIVKLTARQHYICHCLLVRMVDKQSDSYRRLVNAIIIMKAKSGRMERYVSSCLYEKAKIEYSKFKSIAMYKNNHRSGRVWVANFDTRTTKTIKLSELDSYISKGWKKGRVLNFDLYKGNGERKYIPRKIRRRKKRPSVKKHPKSLLEGIKKILGSDEVTDDNIKELRERISHMIWVLDMSPNDIKKKYNLAIGSPAKCFKEVFKIHTRNASEARELQLNKIRRFSRPVP